MIIKIDNMSFDAGEPVSLAIPMRFDGDQPNAFGVPRAVSFACESDALVGDTRRGGSCNFEQVTLIPHCNGTHTECIGHITNERISLIDCLRDPFSIAALVSVTPEPLTATNESCVETALDSDRVITCRSVERTLSASTYQLSADSYVKSLIIRTLPNPETKLGTTYLETVPPYFTTEAMRFIHESGFKHLLVDLPSIDRIYDDGKLLNHRIFWNIDEGSFGTKEETRVENTVTELIYVPDEVADGVYLLNLQIAPFAADAAPANPVVFRIRET